MPYLTTDELREEVKNEFSSLEQELGKGRLKLLLIKFIEKENKYKFGEKILEERRRLNKEYPQKNKAEIIIS